MLFFIRQACGCQSLEVVTIFKSTVIRGIPRLFPLSTCRVGLLRPQPLSPLLIACCGEVRRKIPCWTIRDTAHGPTSCEECCDRFPDDLWHFALLSGCLDRDLVVVWFLHERWSLWTDQGIH